MKINTYEEHISYTFEEADHIWQLAMKQVNNMEIKGALKYIEVIHNGADKLLYGREGLRLMSEVVHTINNAELIYLMKKLLDDIRNIGENDYLNMTAIDVNFGRLYYDSHSNTIMFALLPINYECDYHDNTTWSTQLRNTLLTLLSYIFGETDPRYSDMYYAVNDYSKTDAEIMQLVYEYDYGIHQIDYRKSNTGGEGTTIGTLILEHNSDKGNLIFNINKDKYTLGKSENGVDGVIHISGMISRVHCTIYKMSDKYLIQDMNSTNGTKINGYTLNPEQYYYLNDGDVLSMSDVDFNVIMG